MAFNDMIFQFRSRLHYSQEQFASMFGVSRQSVQKWEDGSSMPDLQKLIKIAKYFDVSIDSLVLDSDVRTAEELNSSKEIKPHYSNMDHYESYYSGLMTEYIQSIEEGLDIEPYKDLFEVVSRLPKDEIKKRLGDILFDIVIHAKQREDYPYCEPSTLEEIRALRKKPAVSLPPFDRERLKQQIHGAWMGRICGCMLGKTVEGIRTNELIPFLKETGNYPMHRYIRHSDLSDELINRYKFRFANRAYADQIHGMPVDDDTNYVVLAQILIEKYGRNFTPCNVSRLWLDYQPKYAYCTAERVAFCNFVKGYEPPQSAVYQNPYREWIGAQIRGDYFGYINPGDPETASAMAFRDASVSHVKNGIYGEMFASAMIAAAACTTDMETVILTGLGQVPSSSRLYARITDILNLYKKGTSQEDCFSFIHQCYDEYTTHGWCHTIANAMIVAASLLYGGGNYQKSVCMAVQTGFDTDCNGATIGSIIGMANGMESISDEWTAPMDNLLHTSIFGVGTVKITDCVEKTVEHLQI